MHRHRRGWLLQHTITLIVLGILAGTLGGIAIGVLTGRVSSSTTTTAQ
ncbi:MAG TPA: hypothetical protein VGS27_22510 [Candidatus Sulfotelmatobacter sp.]|nr:hypothetical protein [Candidatus Sulfotelmatobacter sp.]